MNALDYAKFYSQKTWRIFPCKSDKTPMVKDWPNEATTDEAKISAWWTQFPDAGIGLATGKRSGLFALDVDTGHGGETSLAALIERNGALPETPTSNTGGGGHHYLFQWPGVEIRNSAGKLGAGLDTRGEGGYIVVPPSIHPSGRHYEWKRENAPSKTPLAVAPDWLLKMLIEEKKSVVTGQHASSGAYITGQRNNALTSLAGTMRRRGMTEEAIFLALNVENLNKCVPPLSESEVRAIAASAVRYTPQAEPQTQNRDRVAAEWAFAKCIFESPESALDYQGLKAENISSTPLRSFWQSVLSGIDPTSAATNSGILSDLEHYQDYLLPRLDGYFSQIINFGKIDRAVSLAKRIESSAKENDWQGVDKAIVDINRAEITTILKRAEPISNAWDEFEQEVRERYADKKDVWGIPYAWPKISKYTGGKQLGELVLFAGEPKIGKSWWCLQDAMETAYNQTPVLYWSGEMKRRQVVRRLASLLGLDSRRSRTGYMTDNDWLVFQDAKAILQNIPLYIDDKPLMLHELRPMIKQKIDEFGIKQVVLDYAMKIHAPGKDEVEQSKNISSETKDICNEFGISMILIASVTKQGMDTTSDGVTKANVRGSGQQIHDADLIYTLTKYNPSKGDLSIKPDRYDKIVTLNIQAGRELNPELALGYINYERANGSPKLEEL